MDRDALLTFYDFPAEHWQYRAALEFVIAAKSKIKTNKIIGARALSH